MLNTLTDYLDKHHVQYTSVRHSSACSAQDLAEATHICGWEVAKTTVLKVDGDYLLAVLPAPYLVDLERFRDVVRGSEAHLATEEELRKLFVGCEPGAMPPTSA